MAASELPARYRRARPYVLEARDRILEEFGWNPNINGAGFGRRIVRGEPTDTPACVVYVSTKIPEDRLAKEALLPRSLTVRGVRVEVDVARAGPFYAQAYIGRERPAPSGISVGHPNVTAGTLGCLVTDRRTGNLSILSNNHVLANQNDAGVGDSALQPGTADGGSNPGDRIGSLARWVNINFSGGNNVVDCAIAHTSATNVVDAMKGNQMLPPTPGQPAVGLLFAGDCFRTLLNPINEVAARLDVEMLRGSAARAGTGPGDHVQKTGRTTEYTTGEVDAIDVTATIKYGVGKEATFTQCIATTAMSAGGDSGSVVCRGGSGAVVKTDSQWSVLSVAQELSGVPLTQEQSAIREARDRYSQKTLLGRWGLDMWYVNQPRVCERARKSDVQESDRQLAQAFYAKYSADAKLALADPDRDDLVVTPEHLTDAEVALRAVEKYLTPKEVAAANELLQLAQRTLGKNPRELLALADDPKLYEQVRAIVARTGSVYDPYGD
jgi:hypothetical protein